MTENEAIEIIENFPTWNLDDQWLDETEMEELSEIAITALKEIQQYRALGTVEELTKMKDDYAEAISDWRQFRKLGTLEELQEAMEKQRAKKPYVETQKATGLRGDYDCYECPNCDSFLAVKSDADSDENYRTDYCPNCGQKIDWSKEYE